MAILVTYLGQILQLLTTVSANLVDFGFIHSQFGSFWLQLQPIWFILATSTANSVRRFWLHQQPIWFVLATLTLQQPIWFVVLAHQQPIWFLLAPSTANLVPFGCSHSQFGSSFWLQLQPIWFVLPCSR